MIAIIQILVPDLYATVTCFLPVDLQVLQLSQRLRGHLPTHDLPMDAYHQVRYVSQV
jgi:hypothetical protein